MKRPLKSLIHVDDGNDDTELKTNNESIQIKNGLSWVKFCSVGQYLSWHI
jgi:hypothetical protein